MKNSSDSRGAGALEAFAADPVSTTYKRAARALEASSAVPYAAAYKRVSENSYAVTTSAVAYRSRNPSRPRS
ncbi:hypothetical protein EXE45_08320 [Halorubrum sp. SP9]|nr:hypothetical protein EXE45_08320 [Halorubrum sp. SP9]